MNITRCKYGKIKPCCSVHYCPLDLAWAITVHKVQGLEAWKGPSYDISRMVIDPGDLSSAENRSPGTLYVATSRGTSLGSMSRDSPYPLDSTIYFHDGNMSPQRVLHCGTKLKKNAGNRTEREKGEGARDRDMWVGFLREKAKLTREETYTEEVLHGIHQKIISNIDKYRIHTNKDLIERIANMLLRPNESWKKNRKGTDARLVSSGNTITKKI